MAIEISKKNMIGWWCNNHLEKYEFVNGKDDYPIYEMEKNMFETTNQQCFHILPPMNIIAKRLFHDYRITKSVS